MKRIFFTFCLVTLLITAANSQIITDADKHPFDELEVIKIDVDGDGKLDTIQPRTYQIKPNQTSKRKINPSKIQNWIAFDLITSKGFKIKSFFKYNYGTAEQGGSYWIYALKSAGDINKDGKTDLIFYSGDDTSDETIFLVNKENRFIIYKRKFSNSNDWN